jgi:hypothetical protein
LASPVRRGRAAFTAVEGAALPFLLGKPARFRAPTILAGSPGGSRRSSDSPAWIVVVATVPGSVRRSLELSVIVAKRNAFAGVKGRPG